MFESKCLAWSVFELTTRKWTSVREKGDGKEKKTGDHEKEKKEIVIKSVVGMFASRRIKTVNMLKI